MPDLVLETLAAAKESPATARKLQKRLSEIGTRLEQPDSLADVRLLFLGDSITQGWGDDMHKAFGAMKVANRGISGDTTRGMLIRLQQDRLRDRDPE